jgi:MoxR-like ATPase
VNELIERLRAELQHVVVGQDETIELMLSGLVLGGHVLLQGVPTSPGR